MVKWWLLIVVFAGGLALGRFASPSPPAHLEEKQKDTLKAEAHEESVLDDRISMNVAQVIPGQTVTKWKIKYRDNPDGGCAVESSEGEAIKTDPGSVVISSDQETKRSDSKDLKLLDTHESLRIVQQAPNWHAAVLAGTDMHLKLQGAATASYRIADAVKIKGVTVIPALEIAGAVVVPFQEFTRTAAFLGLGGSW